MILLVSNSTLYVHVVLTAILVTLIGRLFLAIA